MNNDGITRKHGITYVDGYMLCGLREGQCPGAIQITTWADERRQSFRKTVFRKDGDETDARLWERAMSYAKRLNRRTHDDVHAPWMGGSLLLIYGDAPDEDEFYNFEQELRHLVSYAETKRQRSRYEGWLARWLANV